MSVPSSFEAPSPETLGALMPGYEFELLIASGGMGAVYKARQKSLDRDVAIKILPRELVADPVFRKSFETEARAMARLNHPNLIGVYDSGDLQDMAYIVMEFVPGKSLYHSAYGKKIHPVQAVELASGICKGLAHAHDNGILHRDIKPANILLNRKAEPKIGDFGLARPMESDGPGLIMGTPGYTAPEVMRKPETADRRSDLYAVGVILFELLTGERQQPDSPPPSMNSDADVAIDQIWQRATNSNPSLRYPDCHAFAAELDGWLRKAAAAKSATEPSGEAKQRAAPPIRQHAARLEDEVTEIKSKGNLGGILVNLLLLALLAAGGWYGWKFYSDRQKTADQPESKTETTEKVSSAKKKLDEIDELLAKMGKVPAPGTEGSSSPFGETRNGSTKGGGGDPRPDLPDIGGRNPSAGAGKTNPLDPAPGPTSSTAEDTLTPKARELIAAAENDRSKALAENSAQLTRELDQWIRTLGKKEQENWQPDVDLLKNTITNNRVPNSVPDNGPLRLSSSMAKSASGAAAKQKQIDADYLAKVAKYRDFYVSRMKAAIEDGKKAGKDTDILAMRMGEATDVNRWVRGLGGDPTPRDPEIQTSKARDMRDILDDPASPFGTPVRP